MVPAVANHTVLCRRTGGWRQSEAGLGANGPLKRHGALSQPFARTPNPFSGQASGQLLILPTEIQRQTGLLPSPQARKWHKVAQSRTLNGVTLQREQCFQSSPDDGVPTALCHLWLLSWQASHPPCYVSHHMLGHARNRNGTTRPGSNVCRGRGALKLSRPGDGKGRERGEAEAGPTECAVRRFRRIFFFFHLHRWAFPESCSGGSPWILRCHCHCLCSCSGLAWAAGKREEERDKSQWSPHTAGPARVL